MRNLTRLLFILGIVPVVIFIVGLIKGVKQLSWVVVTGSFLLFIIFYTYKYRDFSFMKPVYLYPGLLGFAGLWVEGLEAVFNYLKRYKTIPYAIIFCLMTLVVCQIIDEITLFTSLAGK